MKVIILSEVLSWTDLKTGHTKREPGQEAAADGTEEACTDPGHGARLHSDVCGDVGLAVRADQAHRVSSHLERRGNYHHLAGRNSSVSILLGWSSILI